MPKRQGRLLLLIVAGLVPASSFSNAFAASRLRPPALKKSWAPPVQDNHMHLSQDTTHGARVSLYSTTSSEDNKTDWRKVALFATIAAAYWYLMVLGGLATSQGWPLPDGLPLHPGWPPSDADLQPVLEDSQNFFYLSEVLGNEDAPYVQPVRLAAFNVPEAWMFAVLPVLWKDPRRLNKWILLATWALLGINLTNAFLAPYLLATELKAPSTEEYPKNRLVSTVFGAIATAVVVYALQQCLTVATAQDWNDYFQLVGEDRTYLAFTVDLILFSFFQPIILSRVKTSLSAIDYVPLVGLVAWLFQSDDDA